MYIYAFSSLLVFTNTYIHRHIYQSIPLGLQVCKYYLLWGLKYVNMTYFGLFGAPGYIHGSKLLFAPYALSAQCTIGALRSSAGSSSEMACYLQRIRCLPGLPKYVKYQLFGPSLKVLGHCFTYFWGPSLQLEIPSHDFVKWSKSLNVLVGLSFTTVGLHTVSGLHK